MAAESSAGSSKPNVLLLGACGFVGRAVLDFLVRGDHCAYIRAADKAVPMTAVAMSPEAERLYEAPCVEFRQCNLVNAASVEKIFAEDRGRWNYVINCAAETKYGQPEAAYKDRVLDLSVRCAEEAAKHSVDVYVELSTCQIYQPGKHVRKEGDKEKPWTLVAKYKQMAEERLKAIAGLPLVILRLPIVYGPMDVQGISPRLICGAVYKHLKEKMKFLWTKDLRINTVHVRDVVRAIWFCCTNPAVMKQPAPRLFNVVDKNDTDQGKINVLIEKIFGIQTGFQNMVINGLAKVSFKAACEEVNDRHLGPWMEVCKTNGINDTPLSPFIDPEVLYDNALWVDGSALLALGFTLDHPNVTEQLVREQLDLFKRVKLFPNVFE